MSINQARQHDFPFRINLELRTVLRPNVNCPPNLRNHALIDENSTITEYSPLRVHSDYYASLYENGSQFHLSSSWLTSNYDLLIGD